MKGCSPPEQSNRKCFQNVNDKIPGASWEAIPTSCFDGEDPASRWASRDFRGLSSPSLHLLLTLTRLHAFIFPQSLNSGALEGLRPIWCILSRTQAGFQPHLASAASGLDEVHRPNDFIHRPWSTSGLRKSSLGFTFHSNAHMALLTTRELLFLLKKTLWQMLLVACPSLITCHSLVSNCQHLQFFVPEYFWCGGHFFCSCRMLGVQEN